MATKNSKTTKSANKIPSTDSPHARAEAAKSQVDQPGAVTTDSGPGKRLFQTGPEQRKWLTQKEAEAAGFYWKPDPEESKKKK